MTFSPLTNRIAGLVEEYTGADMTDAQKTFIECLIPALLAGLPGFIDALMKCLAGGTSGYNPGDRPRCSK